MILTLQREIETPNSTIGRLEVPYLEATIYTLEDAWMDNKVGDGRIPAGSYECVAHGWEDNSPLKIKQVYRLLGTEPRSGILIHAGNDAEDTHGCILVGLTQSKDFIGESRIALETIRRHIGTAPFTLEIRDAA